MRGVQVVYMSVDFSIFKIKIHIRMLFVYLKRVDSSVIRVAISPSSALQLEL